LIDFALEMNDPVAVINDQKPMKTIFKAVVVMTLALAVPQAMMGQSVVFSDNFSGSTINGNDATTPPTATSTSYDFDSTKTGAESISSGNLNMALTAASTGGMVQAEALFTTTPVSLSTVNDYIDLTYTFTDTGGLIAGGTGSALYTGLYNSGSSAPAAGTIGVGTSGNAVSLTGAGSPTGGALGWQGYVGRINGSGGNTEDYTRPAQTGSASGTSSGQDVVGNTAFTGAWAKAAPGVAGTQVGGTVTPTVTLTTGGSYTMDYRLTLSAANQITISESLTGTGGVSFSQSEVATGSSFLSGATSFDGLAIGAYNDGTSFNPQMDINSITVTDSIQAVPEPDTFALLGGGLVLLQVAWRRRQTRA
jgi:hypothetical protein